VYFNDPNLINTIVDKERAVTLEDVNAVAKKYLLRGQRTVVITYPAADEKASSKGAQ
jgi:predicted Zn-dependent peptidase